MEDDGLTRLAVPVGDDDHVRGPADAPVTLVEYGDFECPFCGLAYGIVKELEKKYPRQLRVVFRSFPLQQHKHAQKAAEAAEYAADGGKFWEMHDVLYEHQAELEPRYLRDYAEALGLNGEGLVTALHEKTYRPMIDEIKEGGEESGIPGTPAFFLNGILFEDEPTLENFTHAVDYLLQHGGAG